MRATWNGATLAESDDVVVVDGACYFPPTSLVRERFAPSDRTTICPWKGRARYWDVHVDGAVNRAAAWSYPRPLPPARRIAGRVAFWRGVAITP